MHISIYIYTCIHRFREENQIIKHLLITSRVLHHLILRTTQ